MFSVKDITIKQGAKGEYKVLQGAIQTPWHNDPNLYNVNVCIFKDDPDYDIVEVGKVLDRTLTKNTAGYWNFDKSAPLEERFPLYESNSNKIISMGEKQPPIIEIKSRNIEQTQQLILSYNGNIFIDCYCISIFIYYRNTAWTYSRYSTTYIKDN